MTWLSYVFLWGWWLWCKSAWKRGINGCCCSYVNLTINFLNISTLQNVRETSSNLVQSFTWPTVQWQARDPPEQPITNEHFLLKSQSQTSISGTANRERVFSRKPIPSRYASLTLNKGNRSSHFRATNLKHFRFSSLRTLTSKRG